jgi:uncharacterized membrane protein YgaE (UPF0421/DUF939 family)
MSLKQNLVHPARMAIAAVLAFLVARILGLLEAYWAPIAALIVVQAASNALVATSWLLLAGTALGVCAGALLATSIGPGIVVFALGVLGLGLLAATLRLDRRANHFAAVAFVIVLLAGPANQAWHRALYRFLEFSVGIVVALLVSALWPEPETSRANIQNQKHLTETAEPTMKTTVQEIAQTKRSL